MIAAEKPSQNPSGTLINAVDTFSSTVNKVMQTAVDSAMINGLYQARAVNPPPSITGKTGKTHGASTLKTHAINASIHNDILSYKTIK